MKKIIFVSLLSLTIALPVLAAGTGCPTSGLVPCGNVTTCPCEFCDFFTLFQNTIGFVLFTIVPPLAAIVIGIGALLFIVGSATSPQLLNQAKGILNSVVLGLIIVYGAWIFVNTFFVLIGLASTNLGTDIRSWFQVDCSI